MLMSDDDAAVEMKKLFDNSDTENGHIEADELLCRLLKALGYEKTVAEFEKQNKWYA